MNMEITKQKIKARRANKAGPVGKHYTVSRVVREPGDTKCFGFAVADDGETEIYLSSLVIKKEQMTEADIGAGFTCMVRTTQGYDTDGAHPHALLPIKWDGEAEEVEVEVATPHQLPDDVVPLDDFNELAEACSLLLNNASGPVGDLVDRLDKLVQGAAILFADAKKLRDALSKFEKQLDTIAPETE